jgi:integrase
MEIRLPYLASDVDRHGNPRFYVRKRGCPKIRIKVAPGAPEFLKAYEDALHAIRMGKYPEPKGAKGKSLYDVPKGDTLRGLVHLFEQSAEAKQITPRGQRVRHLILRSCLNEETKPGSGIRLGECPTDQVTIDVIRLMRDRKQDKKAASANRVKEMRKVLDWAVEHGCLKVNVARHLKPLKYKKIGFHSWTEEEVEKYAAHHPIGSKARLAMGLMAFTGMRRSDAVLIGPSHVKDGVLRFTPQKTRGSTGTELILPVLPQLQEVLDGTVLGNETFLVTERGQPFTANGFGNWFRDRCDEAGLTNCTAHGLRKTGAAIAAENGATEKQMMAIFGWSTADLAAHYSKTASQKKLAGDAMHLLVPAKRG